MIYKRFRSWEDITNNLLIINKTLLVLDIDNTLIKPKTNLGSDQFFDWQMSEIDKNGDLKLAPNKDKLLELMITLWMRIDYELCEENINNLLLKLKELYNINILLLTSRDKRSYVSLLKNFNKLKLIDVVCDTRDEHLNVNNIYYKKGIIFCSGLDKGICLQIIINRLNLYYEKILFIDDKLSNLENVYCKFKKIDCILYEGCKDQVDHFYANSKEKVLKEYLDFMRDIQIV